MSFATNGFTDAVENTVGGTGCIEADVGYKPVKIEADSITPSN